jgi:hypothetical protein
MMGRVRKKYLPASSILYLGLGISYKFNILRSVHKTTCCAALAAESDLFSCDLRVINKV